MNALNIYGEHQKIIYRIRALPIECSTRLVLVAETSSE